MKIAMKQRLVGTVVLGCLVIIFVPILLDGEGVTPPAMTTSIPQPPAMPVVPDIEPVRPDISADTIDVPQAPADERDAVTQETAAASSTPPPEQPRLNAAGTPEAWAVRLGSFGEQANAEALVARLQEQGYKAFSRPLQTSRGALTGVYVGPVVTEGEAGRLQQELAKSYELEGAVVQFSIEELAN